MVGINEELSNNYPILTLSYVRYDCQTFHIQGRVNGRCYQKKLQLANGLSCLCRLYVNDVQGAKSKSQFVLAKSAPFAIQISRESNLFI